MNENSIFEERIPDPNKKPIHAASLAIGILSLVFSLLIALVGDILGIAGIVLASQKRETHSTKAALVCSIIGLVLSVANHILSFVLLLSYMQ